MKINIRMAMCSAMFTALIAVGAYIKIPGPFVPATLQMQFAYLAGALLGKAYGAAAVGAYILAGLAGAPVFAGGGGIGYVMRPTFGYIIGFLAGAYITGAIRARKLSFANMLAAGIAHFAAVYSIGLAYYYFIAKFIMASPIGIGTLFLYCFALTAPVDAVLCAVCAYISVRLAKILRRGGFSGLFADDEINRDKASGKKEPRGQQHAHIDA